MAQRTVKPAFVRRLQSAIKRACEGAVVEIEHVRDQKYRFVIVWAGFDHMDHAKRQERAWQIVESTLSPEEVLLVTMILTVAPHDLAVAGDFASDPAHRD